MVAACRRNTTNVVASAFHASYTTDNGDLVKQIIRAMIGGICLSVAAIAAVPAPSSACRLKDCSPSGTATPVILIFNEDQFNGKETQFTGEPNMKRGHFTDDVLLFSERRRDTGEGNIQVRYGDRRADVKTWLDMWFEQNKSHNNHP